MDILVNRGRQIHRGGQRIHKPVTLCLPGRWTFGKPGTSNPPGRPDDSYTGDLKCAGDRRKAEKACKSHPAHTVVMDLLTLTYGMRLHHMKTWLHESAVLQKATSTIMHRHSGEQRTGQLETSSKELSRQFILSV